MSRQLTPAERIEDCAATFAVRREAETQNYEQDRQHLIAGFTALATISSLWPQRTSITSTIRDAILSYIRSLPLLSPPSAPKQPSQSALDTVFTIIFERENWASHNKTASPMSGEENVASRTVWALRVEMKDWMSAWPQVDGLRTAENEWRVERRTDEELEREEVLIRQLADGIDEWGRRFRKRWDLEFRSEDVL